MPDSDLYGEDDLLMLSALQHLLFCPRQCALIHVEQLWFENRLTAEGRILHERTHQAGRESRGKVRIETDLPIRSLRLGLIGRADVVEFHRQADGCWQPFPVEYKRGRPKKDNIDKVQLCAQALCLEEMLGVPVPCGALFYGANRRRQEVAFEQKLVDETVGAARELHQLIKNGKTPPPRCDKRCDSCSFKELCLPKSLARQRSVRRYMEKMLS
jgi:CRISPR-associated exonuclease Cas4